MNNEGDREMEEVKGSKIRSLLNGIIVNKDEGKDGEKGAPDLNKIIQDLIDTPASDKNEDQGKFVQLLKGIAFSQDPKSDEFMKKLMEMVSNENFGEIVKSKE